MSKHYRVKIYESHAKDGMTSGGTLVEQLDSIVSIFADSGNDAEAKLLQEVEEGKLPCGKVYQICPSLSVPDLIRSVAIALDGSSERVFLDPAAGLYNEKRRIRMPDYSSVFKQPMPLSELLGY